MINLRLYKNFNKRGNSTKRPADTEGTYTDFPVCLKDSSTITHPVIDVNIASGDPASLGYNYAYIAAYGRYYFVTEWTYTMGIWTCNLAVDVLASFKTQIGAKVKYINRSAAAWDGNLIDTYYPTKVGADVSYCYVANPFLTYPFGSFIVGLIGKSVTNVPNIGGINYYLFTYDEMQEFLNYLLSDSFANIIADPSAGLTNAVTKAVVNPTDYIESCIWFPFEISGITSAAKVQPQLGWWNMSPLSNGCTPLGSGFVNSLKFNYPGTWADTITLTSHPQVSRGKYLDAEPYSNYVFHLEPWGDIPLNGSDIMNYNTIRFDIKAEGLSGLGALEIYNGGGLLLTRKIAQIGVQMSVAQIINDFSDVGSAAVGAVGGLAIAAKKYDIGKTLKNLLNFGDPSKRAEGLKAWANTKEAIGKDILSGIEAYNTQISSSGANGNIISYTGSALASSMNTTGAYIKITRFNLVDENLTENGRPLCQARTINTLTGYIECADGDIDIACLEYERGAIEGYLIGGFFYE